VWGEDQDVAFNKLKVAISQPPVLRMADFSKPFILQTDASGLALGAVLSQEFDGCRQPIAYASRTLTAQERKASSIYELECLAVLFSTDNFRSYLEHAEFLLETYNQALSWLLSHPRQLGKIGRCRVKISSLTFKAQHVRGTQNVVADALSRMFDVPQNELPSVPCNALLSHFPLAFRDVAVLQREDPELCELIEKLEKKEEVPKFCLFKDVLHCRSRFDRRRKICHAGGRGSDAFRLLPYLSLGGHLGVFKTINKIRESFIWKSMDNDIRTRVRNCAVCGLSKPAQNTKLGLLASEVPERPYQKLFIDYVGKFPSSKAGNSVLLVCVDSFSKFVWLVPVREATKPSEIECFPRFRFLALSETITLNALFLKNSHSFVLGWESNMSLTSRIIRSLRMPSGLIAICVPPLSHITAMRRRPGTKIQCSCN
jgi:hypothetical protein